MTYNINKIYVNLVEKGMLRYLKLGIYAYRNVYS